MSLSCGRVANSTSFDLPQKLSGREGFTFTNPMLNMIRSSRRVLLVLSKQFVSDIWSSTSGRKFFGDLCAHDPYCVIVLVNNAELSRKQLHEFTKTIENSRLNNASSADQVAPQHQDQDKINGTEQLVGVKISWCSRMWSRIVRNVKHNFGLNPVEWIDWNDGECGENLAYLMPSLSRDASERPTEIIVFSKHEDIEALVTNVIEGDDVPSTQESSCADEYRNQR